MCEKPNQLAPPPYRLSSSRLPIWALDKRFHCSVIGTCLTIKELLQIGKKLRISKAILNDHYQLHGTFVALVDTRSPEARLINKHLNKKYHHAILRFKHARHPEALSVLWQDALSNGEVAAPFWALVTHPKCSDDLLMSAYGQVHMLSHLSGESIRIDMLKLAKLQHKVPELEQSLNTQEQKSRQALAKKETIIQKLNEQLSALQNSERRLKLAEVPLRKNENQNINEGELPRQNNDQLGKQLLASQISFERASKETQEWKVLASERDERCRFLEAHLTQLVTEQSTMEQSLNNLLSINQTTGRSDNGDIDLCNRCILYVGGRSRQCAHFRTLVEKLNGRFLHHDGGLEENPKRLTSLVAQSDAVLCPLDCVSHDAMSRIKRDCKHQGKSLQILRQSSLATFTHGLHLVATKQ
jgi:hypothetical protein